MMMNLSVSIHKENLQFTLFGVAMLSLSIIMEYRQNRGTYGKSVSSFTLTTQGKFKLICFL
ncbi:hypothetical protein PCC7424_1125 [Gloeothece citriformis PCC 7424]|uniref:Uncharacterized protein n=1 Tax=Gloeothece citriformis (strain PCC 7424) TaxID=65393 RepID=B7KJX7_GLOC7|nr:hypothetical protein PCC7424_1125 [Gloeothece citriformis PCC 7424]